MNGTKVSIKPAKTRVDAHRDAMLNIAANHVKGHAAELGKMVEIVKRNERCVKVNGVVSFQQASRKSLECGTYAAHVADLSRRSTTSGEPLLDNSTKQFTNASLPP